MDPTRFDRLARLAAAPARRRALLAAALAVFLPAAPPPADAAGKRRKKKCPKGTLRCGKACADPQTDARHCGGCGKPCGAGEACANGTCAAGGECPAGRVRCGGACVDPRTDGAHCGACGHACSGGQSCRGGACAGAPCRADQLSCAVGCVDNRDGLACCNVGDCGDFESYSDLYCDTANRKCRCEPYNGRVRGVCVRFPNGLGTCNECCGDGDRICPGDLTCVDGPSGSRYCDCPPGAARCNVGQNLCSADPATDFRRCGRDCADCGERGASWCCNGACGGPGDPGTRPNPELPCREGCQRCPEGTLCCRASAGGGPYGCVLPDEHDPGRCPSPAQG